MKNPTKGRRFLARLLTASLIAFQLSQPAAATDLADVPMAVKNSVAPNIMFTLDDSGSMMFEISPDDHIHTGCGVGVVYMFPRADEVYGSSDYTSCSVRFNADNRYARFFRTAQYNKQYYNPSVRYLPWSNSDGSLMANATPTAAPHNPANSGAGTRNLTVDGSATVTWLNDSGTRSEATRTFYPATYFRYIGSTALNGPEDPNNLQSNFELVEIKSANAPFPKAATRTDCAGATCTYSEEIQNFANWYTYYRSRILSARAGIGRAFTKVGETARVGFGAINKDDGTIDGISVGTVISGVRLFNATNRSSFYTSLYTHPIPAQGTPLRRALDDVGQYFSSSSDQGPWGDSPGAGGGTIKECRASYNVLMTDGYWNGDGAETSDATENVDNTAGPTITGPDSQSFAYAPGNPFSDNYSDTLADVAMHYWNRDLLSGVANRVPTNDKDPAFWQHLVNFTVGLGVFGTVSQSDISSALTANPATIAWPDPTSSEPAKVDDLAHAAVNSRGGYFSAADPEAFAQALGDTLDDIAARTGSAAAVAVVNANVTAGDNASFASSYNSGNWTGDLASFPINLTSGLPESTATWTAQAQLDSRTPASRFIVSYNGTDAGIQFQPTGATTATKLSAAQQARLRTPSATDGAAVVRYLRGDRSGELSGTYRTRAHILGDIVNAEPVVLREPFASYADRGYSTFKTANASRTRMVFQGANDGMLHAFRADTGAESWAYIPNRLIAEPASGTTSNLNILTRKDGFAHKYFVDGTPVVGDVDFQNTAGGRGSDPWATILVGGLGKGGRGYYALNVTSPVATSESNARDKVLWEFPNSGTDSTVAANVGYSFGKPIIVKTEAEGWVVLVTSGYNNGADTGGDGEGYLFVLNARTGELIRAISTGVGSSASPSGLAQISAYVENSDVDNTVEYVYGGDLEGNLWRFNLKGNSSGSWSVARFATLVDGSGNPQPITTAPELGNILVAGQPKRLVFAGTGQYLGDSDVPGSASSNAHASQTQTMYALLDDLTNELTPLRSSLRQRVIATSADGQSRTLSGTNSPVDYSTSKGWYMDLPTSGERVVTDPALAFTTLVFTTNIPNSDPCTPGGSSWIMAVNYQDGTVPENQTTIGSFLGDALSSRPVLIKLPSGKVVALIRKSDARTLGKEVPVPGTGSTTKRVSWREVPEQ